MKKVLLVLLAAVMMTCFSLPVMASEDETYNVGPWLFAYEQCETHAVGRYMQSYDITVEIKGFRIAQQLKTVIGVGVNDENESAQLRIVDPAGATMTYDTGDPCAYQLSELKVGDLVPDKSYDLSIVLTGFHSPMPLEQIVSLFLFVGRDGTSRTLEVKFGGTISRNEYADYLAYKYGVPYGGRESIAWAVENGIMSGRFISMYETYYDPNMPISREDLAYMAWRFADMTDYTYDMSVGSPDIVDMDSVSPYARTAVRWAVESGTLELIDGRFNPSGYVLRHGMEDPFFFYCDC